MSTEFLEFLVEEWKKLEEVEHVSDLFYNDRYDEVDAIIKEIDYSQFYQYMEAGKKVAVSKIPAEYMITSAIYFSGNESYADNEILDDYAEYADKLYSYGTKGACIGKVLLEDDVINEFHSIKELVETGEKYLNEEY